VRRKLGGFLLAGLVFVALTGCSQGRPVTHGWTMVVSVKVGQTPGPVVLGGRWAFVANMSDGTVSQIDRTSGKLVATIAVADPRVLRDQGCAPTSVHAYYSGSWGWRLCDTPYAIAWDGSSLWALDDGRMQLVRVDPTTHEAANRIDLPGNGWNLAISGSTAYVSGFYANHSLYVVDLRSKRLITTITDLDTGPANLTVAPNGVWVLCVRAGTGHLDRIDPAINEVADRYAAEWWSTAIVAFGNSIYVRGTYGGDISRVDDSTGTLLWSQPGPGFIGRQGVDQIGAAPNGIWMSGPSTARIDPGTGQIVDKIPIPSASVATGGQQIWLVELTGQIAEFVYR
jgi:hypothetical protein